MRLHCVDADDQSKYVKFRSLARSYSPALPVNAHVTCFISYHYHIQQCFPAGPCLFTDEMRLNCPLQPRHSLSERGHSVMLTSRSTWSHVGPFSQVASLMFARAVLTFPTFFSQKVMVTSEENGMEPNLSPFSRLIVDL